LSIYRDVKTCFSSQLQNKGISVADYAFINLKGKRLPQLGKYLTEFFVRFGLWITTTDIRSLWETTIEDLHFDNKISSSQRDDAARLVGHSTVTARQTYVKNDTRRRASEINRVVQRLINGDSSDNGENKHPSYPVEDYTPDIEFNDNLRLIEGCQSLTENVSLF
jgi:integrase